MAVILTENLAVALTIAVEKQREAEAAVGYIKDSAFVAGLVDILDAIQNGEKIEVKNGDNSLLGTITK